LISSEDRSAIEGRTKSLRSKLLSLKEHGDNKDSLAEFPPTQRRVLNGVFEVIYESSSSLGLADELIGKIIAKMRRGRQPKKAKSKRNRR
jgi:hypothetical protein